MRQRRPSPGTRHRSGGRESTHSTAVRRVRPTVFEERVYAVVRRIPRGQTRSYRWVAARLGNSGLARAVGNALNRNPRPYPDHPISRSPVRLMALVPCHRVIRSDGTFGDYALGPAKKRASLQQEGASVTF